MFQVLCFVVLSLQAFSAGPLNGTSCITLYQESGTCVKPYLCPAILSAYDAIPDQALEFQLDSRCGCDTGQVCCGPSINNTYSQRVTCGSTTKEKENVIIARVSDSSICGLDKFTTSRIQGGTTADFGEFPWLVAIESNSTFRNDSAGIRCGGSILNKRYILTAAHCIAHHEFVATKVWLGVTNIGPEGNCLNIPGSKPKCIDSVQKMNIQETVAHPSYDSGDSSNDIGLVRVEKLIEYSEYIRPICLPSSTSAALIPGTFMTVAGWGATENNSNEL